MRGILSGVVFAVLGIVLAGCSETREPPTGAPPVRVHPTGWGTTGPGGHPEYMRNWDYPLASCRTCHGADYALVKQDLSCRTCHTGPQGPEDCTTCHGRFGTDPSNLSNAAPPKDVSGGSGSALPTVGAHAAHLAYFSGRPVGETCGECHRVPSGVETAGHLDQPIDPIGPSPAGGSADVLFSGPLAILATEGGGRVPDVSYSRPAGSCAGSYCHGNWGLLKSGSQYGFIYTAPAILGNSASPVWSRPASGACGTCHDLPPEGHDPYTRTECGDCHEGVVDLTGEIADSTLHGNGKVNVFGEETSMGR